MVKDPEVGFMQATYWQLWTSFSVSFCRSYLQRGDQRWHPDPPPRPNPWPSNASNVARIKSQLNKCLLYVKQPISLHALKKNSEAGGGSVTQ